MSLGIIFAYCRGGHRKAEKAAVYYTFFAIAFFFFSILMWAIGAAILNESRNNGKDKDMWGWSCKEGKRKELYEDKVDYPLVCRLQVSITETMLHVVATDVRRTGRSFARSLRSSSKSSR